MNEHINIGYDLVTSIIPEGSKVLDLGCGDGGLLMQLQKIKKIEAFGVEISEEGVSRCVENGLYCYQGDIDEGLSDYEDNTFDFVVLNQTIQNTKNPFYVIKEILRIGVKTIISFPNFGHVSVRFNLLFHGTMPINRLFPYEWYESPDIHVLTIKNFNSFCKKNNYNIEETYHFNVFGSEKSKITRFYPNISAQYGMYVLNGG